MFIRGKKELLPLILRKKVNYHQENPTEQSEKTNCTKIMEKITAIQREQQDLESKLNALNIKWEMQDLDMQIYMDAPDR
jgi:hypothetical protein